MGRDTFDLDFDPNDNGFDPDDHEDMDYECGLGRDGQCSQAGTEHCDFCCPNRNSELFVGSAAWRAKFKQK